MPVGPVVGCEWPKPEPCSKCGSDTLGGIHYCPPLAMERFIETLKQYPQYIAPLREVLGLEAHKASLLERSE